MPLRRSPTAQATRSVRRWFTEAGRRNGAGPSSAHLDNWNFLSKVHSLYFT